MAVVGTGIVSTRASTFLATADARFRGQITLVRIELDGLTLHLATRPYVDPDGVRWDPALDSNPAIDHGGDWLAIDWQPVDAVLMIQDRRLNGQATSDVFSDLFADYNFVGCRVEILQAFDDLVATSEFATIFDGEVAQIDSVNLDGIQIHCVQSRKWSVNVPPRTVNIDDFPNAPKQVLGAAIPILLGNWETNRYLYDGNSLASYAGIARGAHPMLVVDAPTASGVQLPKLIISDDEIDQGALPLGAPYDEYYMYDPSLDQMVGPGIGTLANPMDGPATLTLLSTQVTGCVIPSDVDAVSTATGGAECIRKDKDKYLTGYATLDYTGGQRALRLNLPDVNTPGTLVAAYVYIYYQKNVWAGTRGEIVLHNTAVGTETTQTFPAGSVAGSPTTAFGSLATMTVGSTWISKWEDIKNCYIEVNVKTAGHTLKVHRAVLVVDYKAAAQVERPGVTRTQVTGTYPKKYGDIPGHQAGVRFLGDVTSPDLVSFSAPLYGFDRGRKDTAAGIYTGTASALIEHPVDMVRYLLRRWCDEPSSAITETSGDFGSFVDAKAALAGYQFRTIVSKQSEAADHIAAIGAEALCWFKRTPTVSGAPWVAVPWEMGSPVDYRSVAEPFTFYRTGRGHVVEKSFTTATTRISQIANTIRVNYDWDPRTNTYGDQLYVTPTASRVYSGSFGTDASLEALCAISEAAYGAKESVLSLQMVVDPATASDILARHVGLRALPRIRVRFRTFVNAYDLNRGHVIQFAADWDSRIRFPRFGSDGTWAGKLFRVVSVQRLKESPVEYGVEAVEIETEP